MSHLVPDDVSDADRTELRQSLELWGQLGDIPIDGDERTEETFLHFPPGVSRINIWHWFEEERNVSVAWLMGNKVHPITGRKLGNYDDFDDYGEEFVIYLPDKEIRTPASPDECIYVRVCDLDGNEVAYWHFNEWEEEPTLVMGAIMAAIGTPLYETIDVLRLGENE